MNEQFRHRITGVLFILALAVIFLPMLFDADGLKPVRLEPLPDYEPENINFGHIPKEKIIPARQFRNRIDREGYNTVTGVRTGDPRFMLPTQTTPDNGTGWGIQVGSFTREENARALRDKLLADDYHAALSHIRVAGETSTRVAVGPLIEEAEARKMLQELSARYDAQYILVRFGY